MANPVDFLSVLGSLASLIGLSEQMYQRAVNVFPGDNGQRLSLYITLTQLNTTWKHIHNQYHDLIPDIQNISNYLKDDDGNLRDKNRVTPISMREKTMQSTRLVQKSRDFRDNAEVHLDSSRELLLAGSNKNEHLKNVENSLGRRAAQATKEINNAQVKALESHDFVCEYFDNITPLIRQSTWDDRSKNTLIEGFVNFEVDYQRVILYTDKVMIECVTLFEILAGDLLKQ